MFDRRTLLKLTGVAAVSGMGTAATAQQLRAQSSNEMLFSRDFTDVPTGAIPDDFTLAANSSQEVSASTAVTGGQAYRMQGSHGGCSQAVTRVPIDTTDEMTVRGYYRLGDGEVGCHDKGGTIGLTTTASSSESDGSRIRFLHFTENETVTAQGQEIDSYSRNEWIKFEVEYIHDREAKMVIYNCQINGGGVQSVTRNIADYENDLSALELTSGDFTVYWDDIQIESGVETDEPTDFELSVDSVTPQPVDPGESVTVNVTVTNMGEQAAFQVVDISFDGESLQSREVDLNPEAAQSIKYTVIAPDGAGDYTYEMTTDNDTAPLTIEVAEQSEDSGVGLSIESVTPQAATPGDWVTADIVVTNNEFESRTVLFDIALADKPREGHEITVAAGETTTIEFSEPLPIEAGEYQLEVTAEATTASATVTVEPSAKSLFELTELFPEDIQAEPGESVPVTATITNIGTAKRTELVSVIRNDVVVKEIGLSLAADETDERDIQVTVPNAGGEYEYTVETGQNSQTWSAIVEEAASNPSIRNVHIPSQVRAGESFTMRTEIETHGDSEQRTLMRVVAAADQFETTVYDQPVTLSADSRTTITESIEAPAVDRLTPVVLTVSVGDERYETDELSIEPQPPATDDGSGDGTEITVPGFTVPGTVSALGGAAYLLRRLENDSSSD